MADNFRCGGDKQWRNSTSSESYVPCAYCAKVVQIDITDKKPKESWIELTIRHAREEAVQEVIDRLHKVRGSIPHSVLKLIFNELGYEY